MKLLKIIITLALSFFSLNNLNSQNLAQLDSLASSILKKYNIRGIAMVGVKNGEVIYSKGFGYANETYKMDANTPIYIASNTKAFVGMAMSKLIESGKLNLDDLLIKHIDRKYFPKSIEIEKITIKDIISHNTGLSNDPMTFRTSSSGENPENIQDLLMHTVYRNDSSELIKEFSYSNYGYLLCGIVIENVTGKHWKDYLMAEIIPQLNMPNTFPYTPKGNQKDIASLPYNFTTTKPLKTVKEDNTLHAAGGLYSNLNDMGKWLSVFTNKENQTSTFINSDLKNYFYPLIIADENFGPVKVTGYGYGWYYGNAFGSQFNFHTGGFSGHNSLMSYMPEHQLGFFIFINEASNLRLAALQLTFQFYNSLTNNPVKESVNEMVSKMTDDVYNKYKKQIFSPIDSNITKLPTGTFIHNQYGTLNIIEYENRYELTFGNNLRSIAYKGEKANEIITEFIPGSIESFFIEEHNNTTKIKYGEDYGYFYPKSLN